MRKQEEEHFPRPPSAHDDAAKDELTTSDEDDIKQVGEKIFPDGVGMVRSDRGSSPPLHLLTHSYDRGRDGEYTSYLSKHEVGQFNPNVDFSEWRADDATMRTLASKEFSRGGTLLENLNLSGCHDISDAGLKTIIPAVRTAQMKLLRLNLSGMGGHLTDAVLVVISQVCTQLESLSVSGCRGFSDVGFGAIAGWQSAQAQRLWSASKKERQTRADEERHGWNWEPLMDEDAMQIMDEKTGDHTGDTTTPTKGIWSGGLTKLRQLTA